MFFGIKCVAVNCITSVRKKICELGPCANHLNFSEIEAGSADNFE
jgi:hypothetical protein